jgi:Ca-activated chloride channel family protein
VRRLVVPILAVAVGTAGVFTGIERGNRLYRSGDYAEAVDAYRAALEDGEDTPVLRYNLGTALLKLGRYPEAEEHLRAALDAVDPSTREWVYYNLGQRFLEDARRAQDPEATGALYDAAVESYRQALRLRPEDVDAKWNYELALQEREQQQQSGGGGQGDPQQDQDEEQGGQGQGSTSQGRNQPSQQDQEPGQGSSGQAPLTQEQAERILSAVEQDERELFRDKLRKGQQQTRTTRDW